MIVHCDSQFNSCFVFVTQMIMYSQMIMTHFELSGPFHGQMCEKSPLFFRYLYTGLLYSLSTPDPHP